MAGVASPGLAQDVAPPPADPVAVEADALYEVARQHYLAGNHDEAFAAMDRWVAFHVEHYGAGDPRTFDARGTVGVLSENLGRLAQAEAIYRELLAESVGNDGEASPSSIILLTNVGRVVQKRGRLEEAEPLLARALELANSAFGPESFEVLAARVDYAGLLRDIGQVPRASEMMAENARIAHRVYGDRDERTLQADASYAITLYMLGRAEESAARLEPLIPVIEQVFGEARPTTISVLASYAQVLLSLGRSNDAERVQARVLRLAEQFFGADHWQRYEALGNYAMILRSSGRQDQAIPLLQQALDGYRAALGPQHPQTLFVQQNLGIVQQDAGDLGNALINFEDSLAAMRQVLGDDNPRTLLAMNNLATTRLYLRDFEGAEPLLREVVAGSLRVNGEGHPDTSLYLANHAIALEGLERYEQAGEEHRFNQELRNRYLGPDHPATLLGAANYAHFLLYRADNPELAYAPALQAVEGWRRRRDLLGENPRDAALRDRRQASSGYYFETLLDASWAAQQAAPDAGGQYREQALLTMQDMLAGSAGNAIALSAARRAAEENQQGASQYVRDRQAFNDRWIVTERALTASLGDDSETGRARRDALRAELASLEESMDTLDVLLRYWAPDYFSLVQPDSLTIAEAQALLAEDEAVLMLVPTSIGTHAVAITRDGYQWHRSEWDREQVDTAVRRLQYDLNFQGVASLAEGNRWFDENEAAGPRPYNFATAHALYEQLLAPLEIALADKTHVFVMTSGALSGLPLGLLVSDVPEGQSGDPQVQRNAAWLADRFALVTVPSLQSIRYLREVGDDGAASERPFIGFGNPVLAGEASNRGARSGDGGADRYFTTPALRGERPVADVAQLRTMASLPGTERELRALWRTLGAPEDALFLADAANESAVKRADLDAEVIAFATHGLLAAESDGLAEPGLVLTPPEEATPENDGYLSMSEIAELRINADWVILSACNTAGGDGGENSSGLSGLARAFFFAGAKNLLVSHWPVRDDVAAVLTVRTVEIARENPGLTRAQAFQQAMAEIRNDPEHDEWAHPEAWAPFVLVGDR